MALCPHCQTPVQDSPELAGRVVACPRCARQFRMPDAVPVAAADPAVQPTPFVNTGGGGGGYRPPPKKSSPLLMILGIGALVVIVLPCIVCVGLGSIGASAAKKSGDRMRIEDEKPRSFDLPASAPKPSAPADGVTAANFNRIRTGMSKSEVVAIFGREGELLSENEIGQGTQFHTRTEMYMWKQAGAFQVGNCNIMFQNDKVMQKSQFGLK